MSAQQFQYKDLDSEGLETLDAISEADSFNEWMYKTIKPYCKGEILEIGSGIGNISQYFLKNNSSITLSDIRDNYCNILKKKFDKAKNVVKLDISGKDFEKKNKDLIDKFDTIFALNVIEHIEDDKQAIENCKKMLKKGGNLIILVPSYQKLYNRFDKELQHYRRYTTGKINKVVESAGMKVTKSFYFNFIGMFGWFVSGKLMGNKTIPKGQMGLYNKLVPVFKIIDKILFNSTGLSAISISKKGE